MRYITSLESNIRNGGNFPKPACRQRADGEETWPCLAIRAQQPGIAVDLDTKAKGIEPKHPVSREAVRKFNEAFAYAREHYFAKQKEVTLPESGKTGRQIFPAASVTQKITEPETS